MAATTVPVIAVTGPLGAGKTSVVNALLRAPGARIGVVVNDFGAVNVDAGLVIGQVDEVASITGGCICCLPDSGGLDDALTRLTDPRLTLDAVLVEASGVADPAALSRLIRFSGAPRARWGGVVEVVDAAQFVHASPGDRADHRRLRSATIVVVNKADRVRAVGPLLRQIRALSRGATVVAAVHGGIDPVMVFDVAHRVDPTVLDLAAVMGDGPPHRHATAVTVDQRGPTSAAALVRLIDGVPDGVRRVKGVVDVRVGAATRPFVVHVVGTVPHVAPLGSATDQRALVAIGYDLDVAQAQLALHDALHGGDEYTGDGLRRLRRLIRLSR
ncbi:CobW family GTP-binding protein [Microbacterium sp. M1A1_1b]